MTKIVSTHPQLRLRRSETARNAEYQSDVRPALIYQSDRNSRNERVKECAGEIRGISLIDEHDG